MKGNIFCTQKCPACGGTMRHSERRGNCFCDCGVPASKGYMVRFGREICKRFRTYPEAARFLSGLRFKTDEGSYDRRDYQKDNPLALRTQVNKWLVIKEPSVSHSHFLNIKRYVLRAADFLGEVNIKNINYGHLEDFLFDCRKTWSDKTISNARSALHDFFLWVQKREGITPPEMPEIDFELGYRAITDIDTQQAILDEVDRIAPSKVSLGVDMLATYTILRPDDLLRITEGDISGDLVRITNPTKAKNTTKMVRLLPVHLEKINELRKQDALPMPTLPFFRHQATAKGCRKDQPYGKRYLYKWWVKACANLGIKGLDLYGGTRHTTTTYIAQEVDSLSAKKASGHLTNKAFDRYCQAADDTAFQMAQVRKQTDQQVINIKSKKNPRN